MPEGVSAFVAKVLDQLSLSAWLPAALLSVSVPLLLQFRWQGSVDLRAALAAITENPIPVLLLAVPVLVLATLATQAFSFGAIRALEGYGLRRWPLRWLRSLMIRWQVRRWRRLRDRHSRYARQAFDNAESRWAGEPAEVVLALRAAAHGLKPLNLSDPQLANRFSKLDWRTECDPWDLARVDDAAESEAEFPEESRILPTRLGNLIRSTEDSLTREGGEDLVTFALRRRALLERRVRIQHDQFRTRLDMYCTLVFVNVGLAGLAIALLLGEVGFPGPQLIAAGFVLLGFISYQAALASARGYCTILTMMK